MYNSRTTQELELSFNLEKNPESKLEIINELLSRDENNLDYIYAKLSALDPASDDMITFVLEVEEKFPHNSTILLKKAAYYYLQDDALDQYYECMKQIRSLGISDAQSMYLKSTEATTLKDKLMYSKMSIMLEETGAVIIKQYRHLLLEKGLKYALSELQEGFENGVVKVAMFEFIKSQLYYAFVFEIHIHLKINTFSKDVEDGVYDSLTKYFFYLEGMNTYLMKLKRYYELADKRIEDIVKILPEFEAESFVTGYLPLIKKQIGTILETQTMYSGMKDQALALILKYPQHGFLEIEFE